MTQIDRYAVMGNPVAHSKSPAIHSAFARQMKQSFVYTAILVEHSVFPTAVAEFHAAGGKGLNVTIPFKADAYALSTIRGPRAIRARAVNTLKFLVNGDVYGDNTDGVGLIRDLVDNLGISLTGIRLLILGAGGAARGILQPLLSTEPKKIFIANRTPARAQELAICFADLGPVVGGGFDELLNEHFDLVINATSASLEGEVPPLPDDVLADGAWCYDLMYSTALTPFQLWGIRHGAVRAENGLGMLVEQAAEAFFIWRGMRPDTAAVIRELKSGQVDSELL
ncbi:Shikimate dehydrogenase (NADP(+)) [Gammaproteobacteria bacterium]